MPTTYSTANWRNQNVNSLSGVSANASRLTSTGTVEIRTGTQPASPDSAETGTLLVSFSLAIGALSVANAGVSALAAAIQATAVATGTAGYARWKDHFGQAVIDGSVGVAASGAAFILGTLSITSGSPFQLKDCGLKVAQAGSGALKLNLDLRNKLLDIWTQTVGAINLGKGGTLSVYTGAQPSNPDSPPTGTKLVDIPIGTVSVSAYGSASGGSASLTGNQVANAVATGTAGWARLSIGAYSCDGAVGTSLTEFILDSLSITNGNPVTLTEANIVY